MSGLRWRVHGALLLGASLAAAGCDDAPELPGPIPPDAQSDRGLDAGPDLAPAIDAAPAPPDARPDASASADEGLDARVDGAPDGAADGALDGGDAAPTDADLDGAADLATDMSADMAEDAAADLAPDMPWAPAAHRVFMTGATYTADFDGLAGADAACNAAAAAAGLGGTWRAIISDARTGARDRLRIIGPIETTAGERVAEGADDLWDGAIRAPIAVDARGLPPGGRPDVWTGTDADGTPDARANSFCSDWGRADRPLGGVEIGRGDLIDGRWVAFYRDGASAYNCGSEARLYCIDGQ